MNYTIPPRPGILDIAPYVGGESKLQGQTGIIKLSSNEGAFGPSPKALAAAQAAAADMHRYPDGGATALRGAIGRHFGLDSNRIVCGAGSDEIISLLCFAYAGPGSEVIHTAHGFLMYAISAKAAGATPVSVAETDLRADVDAILSAVTDKTRIVFLANPNNPTGTYLTGTELQRLRLGLPVSVLLVIDAAYAEFVDADGYSSGLELVDQGQNTVMTRTFSKIFAMGGLRLGWAYCPAEVADVLNRERGPFNVSAVAQAAGIAALDDKEHFERTRTHNLEWLRTTEARLAEMGVPTTHSVGNFVLAQFKDTQTAEACDASLRESGIIVRAMAGYGLPQCLRITIGTADEMEACLAAIAAFMQDRGLS